MQRNQGPTVVLSRGLARPLSLCERNAIHRKRRVGKLLRFGRMPLLVSKTLLPASPSFWQFEIRYSPFHVPVFVPRNRDGFLSLQARAPINGLQRIPPRRQV